MSDAETARERWNARYTARADRGPGAPSDWLVEHRELLAARAGGRALDVACGRGRNAFELARLGLHVDAVDVSDVALDRLRVLAGEEQLPIAVHEVDLEREPLPPRPGGWDVIAVFYFLQRGIFGALHEALAPGGVLIYETFGAAHLDELGREMRREFVLERNELLRAFGDLHVVHYREGVVGDSGVASLVAEAR